MVRNLIGYPVILAVTLYIGILNRKSWIIALFFAELILFFAEVVAVIYQKRNLLVKFRMPEPVLFGNEHAMTEVFFQNVGMLPIQRIRIQMEYRCLFGSRAKRKGADRKCIQVWGNVESQDTQSYEVQAGPFWGGRFLFTIPYIRVYDYFGVFSVKIKTGKEQVITIMPELVSMPLVLSGNQVSSGGTSDDSRRGQDPTEIYDIREYQAGDSLRQIYWKRNAGRETILYRESATQKGTGAVLFLQLLEGSEGILFHYQMKIAGSFMYSLLEEGCEHFLAWESAEGEYLERRSVRKEQDIYEVLSQLLENAVVFMEYGKGGKNKNRRKGKHVRRNEKAEKNLQEETILWQEQMRMRYQIQFVGEGIPEAFFLLSRKPENRCSSALILQQETEIIAEFLKDRKFTGSTEEEKLLEKEMREL